MLQCLQAQSLTPEFLYMFLLLGTFSTFPPPSSFLSLDNSYLSFRSDAPPTTLLRSLHSSPGTGIADLLSVSSLGRKTVYLSCSFLHPPSTNSHSRWAIREGLVIHMQVDESRRKRHWTGSPETWVLVQTPNMKCAGLDMTPVCSSVCFCMVKPWEGEKKGGRGGRKENV